MKKIELFTDGSCLGNPGVGGWAYLLRYGEILREGSGGEAATTNNRMELSALIAALKILKEPCEIALYTDSQILVGAINEWLAKWEKNKFKGKKNVDLWQEYLALARPHRIHAHWIKGHAAHPENERCDTLARAAALRIKKELPPASPTPAKSAPAKSTPAKSPPPPAAKSPAKPAPTPAAEKLKGLERGLGYFFRDKSLLTQALTHKSLSRDKNNERLEFLGDAVFDLVVGELLYRRFEGKNEGELSKLRANLVNEKSFAKLAASLGLGEYILLSVAEEKNGGRAKPSLLADALEAVLGAIFLESDLPVARQVALALIEANFTDLAGLNVDHKTGLQEFLHANFAQTPEYVLLGSAGPDHKKSFEMAVRLGGRELARASAGSKKQAQQAAAALALKKLEGAGGQIRGQIQDGHE